ncbi:glycosyl hydrolase 2 galactose-binding domain-containing protein [Vibrio salinus]|uniref:glycosyl hydrolase 2 galactose-binding domain-containing protein n=1 Tax=Vibrio salinus TaxID=2899784 RepID=UPI001E2AB35F|nr:hypothetical protein [Vibrio salinus]MCE0493435.1 hypothetical protein [Vibrio salinus]
MKYSLSGLWQLSPLTDLSIPQDDISFPGSLSQCLPVELSEEVIASQEWHLMHDIEVDEAFLSYSAIDLVLEGIDFYAEVRLNGFALFDCDQRQSVYRKDILPFLTVGRNRFEILFLHSEDDDLLCDDAPRQDDQCLLGRLPYNPYRPEIGIWREPHLQCQTHVRLTSITTEQVWHYGGGCEVLVNLHFSLLKPGLVSARIKFDGRIYSVPIDVMKNEASALFQVDAPVTSEGCENDTDCLYTVEVDLDGLHHCIQVPLSVNNQVSHFPL